jgi:hypothetical protein
MHIAWNQHTLVSLRVVDLFSGKTYTHPNTHMHIVIFSTPCADVSALTLTLKPRSFLRFIVLYSETSELLTIHCVVYYRWFTTLQLRQWDKLILSQTYRCQTVRQADIVANLQVSDSETSWYCRKLTGVRQWDKLILSQTYRCTPMFFFLVCCNSNRHVCVCIACHVNNVYA